MLAPEKQEQSVDEAAIVDEAIMSRRSVRAFLPTPVEDDVIRDILTVAARAPSGTNMQPWRVYVVKGAVKRQISDAILNSGIRAEKAPAVRFDMRTTATTAPTGGTDGAGPAGGSGPSTRQVESTPDDTATPTGDSTPSGAA